MILHNIIFDTSLLFLRARTHITVELLLLLLSNGL